MKLILGPEDKMNTIEVFFSRVTRRDQDFIVNVFARDDSRSTLFPIVSSALQEFMVAASWSDCLNSAKALPLNPPLLLEKSSRYGLTPDIRVKKTNEVPDWDGVEKFLSDFFDKHTEGFKIVFTRKADYDKAVGEE